MGYVGIVQNAKRGVSARCDVFRGSVCGVGGCKNGVATDGVIGGSVANDAVKAVDILWCWILRASVVGDDGSWDGVLGSSSNFFWSSKMEWSCRDGTTAECLLSSTKKIVRRNSYLFLWAVFINLSSRDAMDLQLT